MRIPILCPKAMYRVETHCGDSGAWYWRIVSSVNGQVLAHSESYSSADACLDSAIAVSKNAGWPLVAVLSK